MLDEASVDYSKSRNGSGVPIYYFRQGNPILDLIKETGGCAKEKKMPSWVSGLTPFGIQNLLNGYCYGDGHVYKEHFDSRGYGQNRNLTYSTSSMQLARDLRILHWVLGKPLYTDYIADGGGASHCPMYRMHWNPNSVFAKELLPGTSSVGIKSIEPDGEAEVFDITVEKTHNFVLADSGVIAGNCDDGATVTNQVMDSFGFPTKYALISQKPEKVDGVHPLHHIFPLVKAKGRLWMVETIKQAPIVPLEFCYEIFNGLQRVVVINDDGSYYDFEKWREYRVKSLAYGKKRGQIIEEA